MRTRKVVVIFGVGFGGGVSTTMGFACGMDVRRRRHFVVRFERRMVVRLGGSVLDVVVCGWVLMLVVIVDSEETFSEDVDV